MCPGVGGGLSFLPVPSGRASSTKGPQGRGEGGGTGPFGGTAGPDGVSAAWSRKARRGPLSEAPGWGPSLGREGCRAPVGCGGTGAAPATPLAPALSPIW